MTQTSLILLLLNALSTWFMLGVIWYVQIVQYPLFSWIDKDRFGTYQERFQWRTTLVVGGPMVVEAFTSVLLLWYPPIADHSLLLMGVGPGIPDLDIDRISTDTLPWRVGAGLPTGLSPSPGPFQLDTDNQLDA